MSMSVFNNHFILLSPFDHGWVYRSVYGNWVDMPYCTWFIEPYVVGLFGEMIEQIWKRNTYLWESNSPCVWSLEYLDLCWIYWRRL